MNNYPIGAGGGNQVPMQQHQAHLHQQQQLHHLQHLQQQHMGHQHHLQQQQPPPAQTSPPVANNGSVRKLLRQTLGEQLEFAGSVQQVRAFVTSVDNFFQSTESLASLGKSLYASRAVVFVVDKSMRVILWNDCAIELTGLTRDEVAGRSFIDLPGLVPLGATAVLERALQSCIDPSKGKVQALELPLFRKDGRELRLLCECSALLGNPAGAGMLVVAQDLSAFQCTLAQRDLNSVAETPAALAPSSSTMPPQQQPSHAKNGAPFASADASPAPPPHPRHNSKSVANLAGWDEVKPSYHLEAVLGQGSYGQVVRCKHLASGEIVAIKKIQNVFTDPIDAKRILRELCILRQLNHRNIVQIREIVCPQDILRFQNIFVVFEYLPSDLEKLLHSPQFLTAEHIRWLLLDLLKALKYMHSAAIVHRDLKPANVLLNLSPVAIKICDYGLARTLTNSQLSHPSTKRKRGSSSPTMPPAAASTSKGKKIQRQLTEHVVTRWYRAPEIIFRDHDYSTGIDVWSVGCIFAELLSMQKSSVPSHYAREPLFPGVSCFPLSPGAGQRALPQDSQDQLNTILRVLGSMADEDIAEIADPDVRFYLRNLPPQPRKSFAEMYPGAEKEAIDLLDRMLQMNPRKRMTVDDALSHPYLASIRSIEDVDDDIVAPHPIQLDFDDSRGPLPIPEIRRLMTNEIAYYHPHVAQHVQAAIPPRPPQHRKLNHS
ncbi:CMGC/MAPK protein kinase [Aphanomyces invadans]|uniref:non-specific serine/threonine protein kinase n=1 Tax=Aphanomyces invadans TaxID=157072 RepID=A0A024UWI4_9STRA|nr:CMGC/MAPK protein kinase [Aphanomyces invadans]ETW10302.1 CMGC/MAPK protein kinase [Aphanomyces invadans]|eukprot:XP_008861713.1 CMGC/MAPK protein kinase [Aphanomyces invadans]